MINKNNIKKYYRTGKKVLNDHIRRWYAVRHINHQDEGIGEEKDLIMRTAKKMKIRYGHIISMGCCIVFVYCNPKELDAHLTVLGKEEYFYGRATRLERRLIRCY